MSIEVDVSFPSALLPTPAAWQDAIRASGFAVELDCDFDPLTFSGFLPARYEEKAAGFEYYYRREPNDRSCVSFRWSANPREGATAIIAAACLCQLTGGELVEDEGTSSISSTSALTWARQNEANFKASAQPPSHQRIPKTSQQLHRPWWRFW